MLTREHFGKPLMGNTIPGRVNRMERSPAGAGVRRPGWRGDLAQVRGAPSQLTAALLALLQLSLERFSECLVNGTRDLDFAQESRCPTAACRGRGGSRRTRRKLRPGGGRHAPGHPPVEPGAGDDEAVPEIGGVPANHLGPGRETRRFGGAGPARSSVCPGAVGSPTAYDIRKAAESHGKCRRQAAVASEFRRCEGTGRRLLD